MSTSSTSSFFSSFFSAAAAGPPAAAAGPADLYPPDGIEINFDCPSLIACGTFLPSIALKKVVNAS